jgi:small-conductance mechanosensitive channel
VGPGGARSETLLLLLRKFLMAVILAIVCLLLLSSMGINIGPLLAGAGVIGLAIGFGAQTLVREMDDSAMIMRVKFVCVPGERFVLRREVFRRMQEAFQKHGIEFSHRNVTVYFPSDSDTTESNGQVPEKKADSDTRDQKKKEAAAAFRTIEEKPAPEDKSR